MEITISLNCIHLAVAFNTIECHQWLPLERGGDSAQMLIDHCNSRKQSILVSTCLLNFHQASQIHDMRRTRTRFLTADFHPRQDFQTHGFDLFVLAVSTTAFTRSIVGSNFTSHIWSLILCGSLFLLEM